MANVKQFALNGVLSVIYDRSMPGIGDEEILDILQFMVNRVLSKDRGEVEEVLRECSRGLRAQFPLLGRDEEVSDFAQLQVELDGENSADYRRLKIEEWRDKRALWYGEILWVERLMKEKEMKQEEAK